MIIIIPATIVKQPQSAAYSMVRNMGVDKNGEEFEVTILSYIPAATQNFSENYVLTSAKDKSVTQALDKAGDYLGKQIALAHLNNVVVSEEAAKDLIEVVDILVRMHSISNSTNVICTNVSAKEFMEQTIKLAGKSSSNESGMVQHNVEFVTGFRSDAETVLTSGYSPNRTACISMLTLSNEGFDLSGENLSAEGSSDSGGGSSSSGSSGGSEKKKLTNDGSVAVLLYGRKVGELSGEDVKNLNWLQGDISWNKLKIENYSDENLQDATVLFSCTKNNAKSEAYFDGDNPVIKYNINLELEILEINQKNNSIKTFLPKKNFINEKMQKAIADKLKSIIYPSLNKFIALNADPYMFYEKLMKKDRKKFEKYINSLENKEEYMKNIKILFNISSKSI